MSSFGFAGIGASLMVLNRSSADAAARFRRLRALGVVASGLMLLCGIQHRPPGPGDGAMTAIIENTIEIARTPEVVFDYLADQGNEVHWNPDCSSEQL